MGPIFGMCSAFSLEDDLVGVFGFSRAEAVAIRSGKANTESVPFLEQLQSLEIKTEPFQGKTLEEILDISWEEIERLIPLKLEQVKFRNWRRQTKAKQVVKEKG
eukprot:6467241-Amphidinium_carterae.1